MTCPNQWLERAWLRRHGSCGRAEQQPRRLASPLSHTVESVGKGICRKPAINTIKYLGVGKQPQAGFFYRLVRCWRSCERK
jgi:hypothetical protein